MSLNALNLKSEFSGRKVVIVGDLVADQYLNGTINRVSREAPVFILRHDETDTRPGGAANTAANIASLNGDPILIGVVGQDESGRLLLDSLKASGVSVSNIISVTVRKTNTKVRVLAGQQFAPRQQVIRIDYEDKSPLSSEVEAEMLAKLSEADSPEAIIISDYGYGTVTAGIYEAAKAISHEKNIPLIVDSRFSLQSFHGATGGTPNLDEVANILGSEPTDDGCEALRNEIGYAALLVTCGNKGMRLYENGKAPLNIEAVGPTEPVDVTGAGDTVIATYTLALAAGSSHGEAASIANHAGGIAVMKKGSAQVTADEVVESIKKYGVADNNSLAV